MLYYLLRWFCRLIGLPIYKRHTVFRGSRRRAVVRPLAVNRTMKIAQATREHAGYPSAAAFVRATSIDAIYARDRGRCGICKRKVDRYAAGPKGPSLDHIKPLARGGKHAPENLQLSHLVCNQRKGKR